MLYNGIASNEHLLLQVLFFRNPVFKYIYGKNIDNPTLITTYGVVENTYSGELQSVITGEDLFT